MGAALGWEGEEEAQLSPARPLAVAVAAARARAQQWLRPEQPRATPSWSSQLGPDAGA